MLWFGLPVLIFLWHKGQSLPDWTLGVAVYLFVLWFFKGVFMFSLLTESGERREAWQKQYRWFGTLWGTLFGLLVMPAIVAGAILLVWGVFELAGL